MEIINYETAEINERLARVDTLESRVSGLTGLKFVNSTAEMTDTTRIYVNAADGNWYEYSGGNWVPRGQYGGVQVDAELKTEGAAADAKATGGVIGELSQELDTITGNRIIDFESGYFINTNIDSVDITKHVSVADYRCAVVPATAGDIFTVSAVGQYNARPWAFIAQDGTILDRAPVNQGQTVTITEAVITAPDNSAYLIINDKGNKQSYIGSLKRAFVEQGMLSDGADLNNLYLNGWYDTAYAHNYINAPVDGTNTRKFIAVISNSILPPGSTAQKFMYYCDITNGRFYARVYASQAWGSWVEMGKYEDPSAARFNSISGVDSLDDLYANGWYNIPFNQAISDTPDGATSGRRLVVVLGTAEPSQTTLRYMIYINYTTNGLYIRMYHDQSWDEWKKISSYVNCYTDGSAVNVRYPLNGTYSGANPDPYTYHKKVVTLAHFSDLHSRVLNFREFMEWANNNTSLYDDILCTGDAVEWYNETIPDLPNYPLNYDYMAFWKAIPNTNKILFTIGNHDAKNEQVSGKVGWARKTVARSRELYMYGIDNWGVTSPSGTTWWYKDYTNSDLRLIGLDTTVVHDSTDDTAQQTWFINVLNDAKTNGKSVVVAQHYQPNGPAIDCDFSIESRTLDSASYFLMPVAYQQAVQDFINGGGEFICWLAGHTHCDFVKYDTSFPDQMFFIVTSLWNDLRTSDQARTEGTSSFIAANLIGFDTDRKLIKISRIGANYDFNLRPRNILVYNYQTKTIIRQSSGMVTG